MKLHALLVPIIALAVLPGSAAMATHRYHSHSMMSRHHHSTGVYVCKMCKMYYPKSMAMKMGYKDGMGHKLVYMHSRPHGYTMGGSMSHSGHSMSGMSHM